MSTTVEKAAFKANPLRALTRLCAGGLSPLGCPSDGVVPRASSSGHLVPRGGGNAGGILPFLQGCALRKAALHHSLGADRSYLRPGRAQ